MSLLYRRAATITTTTTTRRLCKRCHSSRSGTITESHDVVVVGGGPAGLALTAALASSSTITSTHKITLLEASKLDSSRDWNPLPGQLSNRVSSITAENVGFLNRAGIWKHVDHSRTRGIEEMQVWDGISDARIEFIAPSSSSSNSIDYNHHNDLTGRTRMRNSMATLTENVNLQRAALKRIEETGEVEIVDGMKVESIVADEEGGWPIVNLGNQDGSVRRSIRARLLIGADGANSPVKSYSDIDTFGWAYDRQGVVSSLNLDPSVMGEGTTTAWQRFLPEGPIAFLPLSDTTASLVWSTTPTYASLLKALPSEALSHLVNLAFCLPYDQLSTILSGLSDLNSTNQLPTDSTSLVENLRELYTNHLHSSYDPTNPPPPLPPTVVSIQPKTTASFPLRLSHTSSYLGLPSTDGQDLRTVLVGDAAHTIHPLAGQGLNMGLSDSSTLVSTLETISRQGGDLGSYVSLLPYPRDRYVKNHALLSTCDHLNSLYGTKSSPVVWLRSTGLETLNELDSVKNLLMGGAGAGSSTIVQGGSGGGMREERNAGVWGTVASGLEGIGQARQMVGAMFGLVGGMVKKRATEFVVKGR